jgi:predicted permease
MQTLWQDFRYGLRMLAKARGFTAVVIFTLALGIGANTALFSVVNGVLIKPLPFPHQDELVNLFESKAYFGHGAISYPNFLDWQRENRSFTDLAAYRLAHFTLTGAAEAERVKGEMVSAGFFPILGVERLTGRTFTRDEDRLGGAPVALMSEGFWRTKFGSAPDILSRTVVLDGTAYRIVGIVPSTFHLEMNNFETCDFYTPIGQWNFDLFRDRKAVFGMDAVGRLKAGVTIAQAQSDMDRVTGELSAAYPQADKGIGAALVPLKDAVVVDIQSFLLLLMGAVGFVLLIAGVNVASLLLARSTSRRREFAIRAALGASRARMISQLLTESLLLASAGGTLGLLLASWGLQGALKLGLSLFPEGIPRATEITLDTRVLIFAAATTLLVGVLFGLGPALSAARHDPQEILKKGGRGATTRAGSQRVFVIAELAMALILLIGAGLTIRSLLRLSAINPGFNSDKLVTFYLSLPPSTYSENADSIRAHFQSAAETIASVPGVNAVSMLAGSLPMQGDSEDPFWIEGRPKILSDNDKPWALWYEVDPGYLKAMGIPLLRGRFFTASDNTHSAGIAVIDSSFAARYFPNEDPIGKTLVDEYTGPRQIVGVIGHVKHWGLDDAPRIGLQAQMYFPLAQVRDAGIVRDARGIAVAVRSDGDPSTIISSIRRAVTHASSEEVIFGAQTMRETISRSLAAQRFSMTLFATFAGIALLLASVGIYGVISYLVGQRTHEIGIRVALGAQRQDVFSLVLGQGIRMAVIGAAIGLIVALALTRVTSSVLYGLNASQKPLLYGVTATDPVTFVSVSVLLVLVAALACYIPARRAMRVDPLVALRYE